MPDDETPGLPCSLCGHGMPDIMKVVTIRIPGRRPWNICLDCFNWMWKERSARINEE